jgi:GNAT superfamily N-acetyltransferase
MELTFYPLTPERWDDFVALFSERGVQNGCWCTYWRRKRAEYHHNYGEKNKQFMQAIVQAGQVPGILAYGDGKPIAWCGVAPRREFASLERSPTLRRVDDQPVWSIVCFFVSAPYRNQGLNRKLVVAAIRYAQSRGAKIVEAYPFNTRSIKCLLPDRYLGVLSTFEKVGFQAVPGRSKRQAMMRYIIPPAGSAKAIKPLEEALPELMSFAKDLAWRYQCGAAAEQQTSEGVEPGAITAEEMHIAITEFFTAARMEQIESVIPGWKEMSGYAKGQTLVHTMCMLVAMLAAPEYKSAAVEEKRILEWVAILHDLSKRPQPDKRDHTHAFRSAARVAKILPHLGWQASSDELHSREYSQYIEEWSTLTSQAVIPADTIRPVEKQIIQDNTKLPEILEGIDRLFGPASAAARLVQCILLHASLDTVPTWPCPAGLSQAEARHLIDPPLLPLLAATLLADSDAWNLFDLPAKEYCRQETLKFLAQTWPTTYARTQHVRP